MLRLSHSDLQSLQNCIREIYSDLNLDEWHSRLLSVISKAIPSELINYSEINPLKQEYIRFIEMPSKYISLKDIPIFAEYMHEHPTISLLYPEQMLKRPLKDCIKDRGRLDYVLSPECQAVKLSDFLTNNQFRRLRLYNEFFRKYDIEYQMVVPISHHPSTLTGIVLNRNGKDFSEQDRLMLNILAPHIVQAYKNAKTVSAIQLNVRASAETQAGAIDSLTLREAEVLHWVAQGKDNATIAAIMQIRICTVKKHLENIFAKLGVENRVAAARIIMENNKSDG
ncbi:MAG: helix-turn-helix transcriptional regulator [Thermodesulfovibrionales bacterium]|jgi:DNA-binding CsgD family transcriptional regulator|nr:helix-turn-helix transcriptional regulator [Thermodesulfovibrionales bacterium]